MRAAYYNVKRLTLQVTISLQLSLAALQCEAKTIVERVKVLNCLLDAWGGNDFCMQPYVEEKELIQL